MRFKTVEEEIIPILKSSTLTRCDDMLLYYCYVKNVKNAMFINAFIYKEYRIERGIAPYETVSRVRRKIQEKYPELRPTTAQVKKKKKAAKDYKAYAKDKEQLKKGDEQLAGQKNIFDYI